jgi:hypothetical protein
MNPRGAIPGQGAVMAGRKAGHGLDFFPTPPWATRALIEDVLRPEGLLPHGRAGTVWEPACGGGHMARVLAEAFQHVFASDVHDWGYGDRRDLDFTDIRQMPGRPAHFDWIITNPPFRAAEDFLVRALAVASSGVALLVRLQWLEGSFRYAGIFSGTRRPRIVAPFAGRVAMIEGAWDPQASSATAYCWVVWHNDGIYPTPPVKMVWIAPDARMRLTRAEDAAFAAPGEARRRRQAARGRAR